MRPVRPPSIRLTLNDQRSQPATLAVARRSECSALSPLDGRRADATLGCADDRGSSCNLCRSFSLTVRRDPPMTFASQREGSRPWRMFFLGVQACWHAEDYRT